MVQIIEKQDGPGSTRRNRYALLVQSINKWWWKIGPKFKGPLIVKKVFRKDKYIIQNISGREKGRRY